jgi:hypothetical protein
MILRTTVCRFTWQWQVQLSFSRFTSTNDLDRLIFWGVVSPPLSWQKLKWRYTIWKHDLETRSGNTIWKHDLKKQTADGQRGWELESEVLVLGDR